MYLMTYLYISTFNYLIWIIWPFIKITPEHQDNKNTSKYKYVKMFPQTFIDKWSLIWKHCIIRFYSWSEFLKLKPVVSMSSGRAGGSRLLLGSGRTNALALDPARRPADERRGHESAQIGPEQTLTHRENERRFNTCSVLVLDPARRPADERRGHESAQIGPEQTLTHRENERRFNTCSVLVLDPARRPADERRGDESVQIGPAQTLTHRENEETL